MSKKETDKTQAGRTTPETPKVLGDSCQLSKESSAVYAVQDVKWIGVFLERVANGCTVTDSCKAAGVTVYAPYKRAERDPQFAADWEHAKAMQCDRIRSVLWEEGVEGVIVSRSYGDTVETYRKRNAKVLLELAKARLPEHKQQQPTHVEVRGDGATVNVLSTSDLAQLQQLARKAVLAEAQGAVDTTGTVDQGPPDSDEQATPSLENPQGPTTGVDTTDEHAP